MTRKLEELEPGTPVRTGDGIVAGEVRAVYASGGDSLVPTLLCVFWTQRGVEALIETDEVLAIDDDAVQLRSSLIVYADLIAFDPAQDPLLKKLR